MESEKLQMSLKNRWFIMTKLKIKPEDYREINEYWCKRLFNYKESKLTIEQIVRYIKNYKHYGYKDLNHFFEYNNLYFKSFSLNIMTLGYPKSTDIERILKLEHNGIEIRTGNPEWGAEEGKIYFVIKHGNIIQ